MPKARSRVTDKKHATLYLLRSVDTITKKPMSVKLGYSSRPIQQRQDELSASREKFTTRLALHTTDYAPLREKLAKLLLNETIPTRWYYSARSREFMHHRAAPLARAVLRRVCAAPARRLRAEVRAAEARRAAGASLLTSPMADATARVVHIRSPTGANPVPDTEALYFPRSDRVYHMDEFWTPAQYLQLRGGGARGAAGRLWCFSSATRPMMNLKGDTMPIQ